MASFSYKALDHKGETEKGFLVAENIDEAQNELKNRKLIPIKLKEYKQRINLSFFSSISNSKLSLISRQLSTLINSGIPVDQALDSVSEQIEPPRIGNKLRQVSLKVKSGYKLSESLEEHPESFDRLFCSLIKAGESSGELGKILEKTSDFLEKRANMSQEITGALVYPLILFTVAIGIISLLLVYVVPDVVSQFSNLDRELPLLTKSLLFLSQVLTNPIFQIFIVLFCLLLYVPLKYFGTQKVKFKFDEILLKIPVVKNFLLDADLSRFTSSLSLLRLGNVSILNALKISSDTISNSYLRSSIIKASSRVGEGESLAKSLGRVNAIPPLVIQMIQNGEKSGKLEDMLSKLSDYLETRFRNSTKIAMNLFEPLVIIILGVFVALIVLAILLPLIQLNTFTTTI
jgi:general secretion pathway protein F